MQKKVEITFTIIIELDLERKEMRRLQVTGTKELEKIIRSELRRSSRARYDHRLHGVLLVCRGLSCQEVGEIMGEHGSTIQRWFHRFRYLGLSGLKECGRSGRPGKLTENQFQSIKTDLQNPPSHSGMSHDCWNGRLLSQYIEDKYGMLIGIRQCQRIIKRCKEDPISIEK